jgi:hypothetical protein
MSEVRSLPLVDSGSGTEGVCADLDETCFVMTDEQIYWCQRYDEEGQKCPFPTRYVP